MLGSGFHRTDRTSEAQNQIIPMDDRFGAFVAEDLGNIVGAMPLDGVKFGAAVVDDAPCHLFSLGVIEEDGILGLEAAFDLSDASGEERLSGIGDRPHGPCIEVQLATGNQPIRDPAFARALRLRFWLKVGA